jgi:peptidoglycan/LPS O-acetylase OafA/YrhL
MNDARPAGHRFPRFTISTTNPSRPSAEREFLPHVEGLRAVAVLAVLWYHIGLPGMPGGFVGVDIFFVISGFLITGLLVRERESSGRISLRNFYSRRMRRILPAVLATIAATMVVAALVLAPLQVPAIAQDGAAAALSLGNMRFAVESSDYFAATDPSPFRHLWSLGVEEQFYLVWPTLVILAFRVLRGRVAMTVGIGALTVASFAFGLWLTDTFAPWAFYSLPSRLWELALGGLLAVTAGWLARVPGLVLILVGLVGAGLVAASVGLIDSVTPYPGTAALLPTLGAAALIVGGRGGPLGWLLTREPVRFIGRISYSLYLWHWPILVLPSLATGEPMPLWLGVVLGVASVAVAAASWRLIEEPFRRGRLWARRPRLVLATAISTAVVVAVFSVGLGDYSLGRVEAVGSLAPQDPIAEVPSAAATSSPSTAPPSRTPLATAGASAAESPSATASPADDPEPIPGATPEATPSPPDPTAIPNPWPLPTDIHPSLAAARSDKERIIGDGCFMSLRGSKPPDCVYGNRDGAVTIALVGDSHAAHWFPAVEAIANAHGWRLLVFVKASCVFVDLPIYSPILKREYTECEGWRPQVVQRLVAANPDLTIVSSDRWLPPIDGTPISQKRQGEALARLLAPVPGAIALLADTPASRFDVPVCLSQHPDDIRACATDRLYAFGRQALVRERTAVKELASATMVDLTDAVCPGDPCQAVVDGMIVQRDDHHLTATFAAALAPALEAALPIPR